MLSKNKLRKWEMEDFIHDVHDEQEVEELLDDDERLILETDLMYDYWMAE